MYRLELHDLYSAPNIILVIQSRGGGFSLAGNVTCTREKRSAYKVLVGKVEGGSPHGITGRRLTPVLLSAKITRQGVTTGLNCVMSLSY